MTLEALQTSVGSELFVFFFSFFWGGFGKNRCFGELYPYAKRNLDILYVIHLTNQN